MMPDRMKWSRERIWSWYEPRFPILGCNYLPKTAVNATEMWQAETFDAATIHQELALARDCGMNSLRVFLPFLVWRQDAAGFKARFKALVDLAAERGMSVMPILFDDCAFAGKEPYPGRQDDPVPGVHNSGWTPSPGFAVADDPGCAPLLRAYVQDLIGAFNSDERILAWDLYNEPGNSGRGNRSLPLVEQAFAWARECSPLQPLTACVWNWKRLSGAEMAALELSDVVSFHSYNQQEITQAQIHFLQGMGRPLLCTEWLHRPMGNRVSTHLPLLARERVGLYNWGLVLGRTQTNLNWSTMKGEPDPNPEVWQHDLFYADGRPYDPEEIAALRSYTEKETLALSAVEMTPAIMAEMERRGLIIRLTPGALDAQPGIGETLGRMAYEGVEGYGPHKLISVTVNRRELASFGTHPDNEEFLLIGSEAAKPVYLVIFLGNREEMVQKVAANRLSEADFAALRLRYNDPAVSFFVMRGNVPHGECCGVGGGAPGSFYVTESRDLPLDKIPLGRFALEVKEEVR